MNAIYASVMEDAFTVTRKSTNDDKANSMKESCAALKNNFEGHGQLQNQLFVMSKFGNCPSCGNADSGFEPVRRFL